jgi:hypothetical protein
MSFSIGSGLLSRRRLFAALTRIKAIRAGRRRQRKSRSALIGKVSKPPGIRYIVEFPGGVPGDISIVISWEG